MIFIDNIILELIINDRLVFYTGWIQLNILKHVYKFVNSGIGGNQSQRMHGLKFVWKEATN